MPRFPALFLLIATLLLAAPGVRAHPHAWIDLRSSVVFDEAGRVVAVDIDWLFDDMYSALIREDMEAAGQPEAEFLAELARENVKNLAEYDYFFDLRVDGERRMAAGVEDFETAFRDKRLSLRMRIPLAEPVDPRRQAVVYGIYDPTYYIEILHLEGDVVEMAGPGAGTCVAAIVSPNPSFEAVTLAASLDKNESAGDSLGEIFAEKVHIRCDL